MRSKRDESGFALILSILALMLLTFLGLTLAATTSTELQIATNYRWSQQAYYNAEAGIEAAKVILRNIPNDWSTILPQARGGTWNPQGSPAPTTCSNGACPPGSGSYAAGATRNWEGTDCDTYLGTGYGAVLDDNLAGSLLNSQVPGGPYQNVTTFLGQPINGAFTLWVRREAVPVAGTPTLTDDTNNTTLVLVSEGVAPRPTPAGAGGAAVSARAVRLLQVKLTRAISTAGCQAAEGQSGTTASGANFGACAPLSTGSVDAALGGGAAVAENAGVK